MVASIVVRKNVLMLIIFIILNMEICFIFFINRSLILIIFFQNLVKQQWRMYLVIAQVIFINY